MSRLLTNLESSAALVGTCTFCEQEFPRTSLAWSGGRPACADCRAGQEREEEARREEILAARPERPEVSQIQLIEKRVDSAFHYGHFAIRWGIYVGGCYMATRYDAVGHMLFGAVIADVATWIGASLYDLRTKSWPVILEFVAFLILTQVMFHTDWIEVPRDPAAFGIAFLAFAAFFTVKATLAFWTRAYPDED